MRQSDDLALALEGFLGEHRRCGEMDGGVEDDRQGYRVWMTCSGCGARLDRLFARLPPESQG